MMKKTDNFFWSDAANAAFQDLKKQLAEPPVLAAPIDKEPLLLYVAANTCCQCGHGGGAQGGWQGTSGSMVGLLHQ